MYARTLHARAKEWRRFWADSRGGSLSHSASKSWQTYKKHVKHQYHQFCGLICWYMVTFLTHKMAFTRKALRVFGSALRSNRTALRVNIRPGSNLQVKLCDCLTLRIEGNFLKKHVTVSHFLSSPVVFLFMWKAKSMNVFAGREKFTS